ncbi:hypothetical protein FJT64_002646 [Amphibalanus amphitrite]|uniref:Uncharacterized protein n=1 Tax=Amphibalanus amphitrite TaxID=1232801 RepID=A0A6A4WAL0_AMPAM|nr:hypothetical protein FJT64_002646 [Amphibalanus amphitrite]
MSESELDNFGRSRSLRRLRQFFRKSLPFQKFPSLQTLRTHEDDDEEELLDSQSLDHPGSSIPSIGAELRQLHERLGRLKRQVMEIKEKNTADLSEMSAVIKRGMERVELFGEQLDDFRPVRAGGQGEHPEPDGGNGGQDSPPDQRPVQ